MTSYVALLTTSFWAECANRNYHAELIYFQPKAQNFEVWLAGGSAWINEPFGRLFEMLTLVCLQLISLFLDL